jgi:DnaJ family protein C protein 28
MFAASIKSNLLNKSINRYASTKALRDSDTVSLLPNLRRLSTLPSHGAPHESSSSDTPPTEDHNASDTPTTTTRDHSTSSKLFADAAREESDASTHSLPKRRGPVRGAFAGPDEPWTGDESMQDAVLRMLVDKYKPLRGDFMSADQRLKKSPPTVRSTPTPVPDGVDSEDALEESASFSAHLAKAASSSSVTPTGSASSTPPPPSGALADVPLLPTVEGHRPWHTTYIAPKYAASVKVGRISPSSSRPSPGLRDPDDPKQRKDMEKMRRRMQAVRLTSAKESTLDYRLGLRKSAGLSSLGGNAISLKQWDSIVEEKIEVQCLFRCI